MAYPEKEKNPQFVKLIFYDEDLVKVSIPRKFAKQFGHRLSNPVTLEVPSGSKWQVEVVRNGGQIWLQKGWEDFVKYYSISYASFLKFEYVKKLGHFSVNIFDKTCSETHYPFNSSNGDHEINANLPDDPQDDDDVSVEILEHVSPSRKAKGKSKMPLTCNPRGQVEETIQVDVLPPRKLKEKSVPPFSGHGRRMEQGSCSKLPQGNRMDKDLSSMEEFTTINPYFRVELPPSIKHNFINIPMKFMKKYKNRIGERAGLQVEKKVFLVKIISTGTSGTFRFSAGVSAFIKENSLEVGDICFFELMDCETTIFKVSIFCKP